MNAITQNPVAYKVKKTLIISQLAISPPASDNPDSVGHVQMAVNTGTDTIRVSGNISRHAAISDVVGLLKAAAIAMAKGDPKETRAIEISFVGEFLQDYGVALIQPVKDNMVSEYEKDPYWKLIGDVIFFITGDRPSNQIYVTSLMTKGPVTNITGVMFGAELAITSTLEPEKVITKLARLLMLDTFGPNFATNLTDELIKNHFNAGFSKDIFDKMSELSPVWQTYLIENYPPEPSDAAKELAAAMQKGEHENCLTKLVDFMFDKNVAWDPEQQLQRNITGKAHGAEVQLTVIHAVGNFFVKGYVGNRRIRIFKTHSTINIHAASMEENFDMDHLTKSFMPYEQAEFEDWLIRLAKAQAPKADK